MFAFRFVPSRFAKRTGGSLKKIDGSFEIQSTVYVARECNGNSTVWPPAATPGATFLIKLTSRLPAHRGRKEPSSLASVRHVCELDRLRFCGGIQPGNAQILGCMYASRNALSPVCQQALVNSGYEAPLDG